MQLSEYKKDYYFFSGKVSDITRQMALAGIAIIWVFKISKDEQIFIDKLLIYSAFFIAMSLLCDISQYIYQTIVWKKFFDEKELKRTPENEDILAPREMNTIPQILFWAKVILVGIAYLLIIIYLVSNIFCK